MEKATQHELQLARRMSRLGTETAFEVLNKARALERQGKSVIHLEIGEPDFDTPANVIDAGINALRGGWTHYGPAAGQPELRQALADYVSRTRGVKVTPEEVVVVPRRQAHYLLHDSGAHRRRRQSYLSQSWLPDLRIDDSLRRRTRCADSPARRAGFFARCQRTGFADQRPHQADYSQLAGESTRRTPGAPRHRADCARHRRPQYHGAFR